jgi:transcriptional regulator with XRE-family HTH domain
MATASIGENMKNPHFALWLQNLLEKNNISIKQLADTAGVSTKDVQNWVKGRTMPKTSYFVFLLKALEKLTETEEEMHYLNASYAILKDS